MDTSGSTDLQARIQEYLNSDPTLSRILRMEDDDNLSTPVSPTEDLSGVPADSDSAQLARQLASLRSYIESVPYICESAEEMERKFANIVDMMYVSAKSDQVELLRGWDGVLSTYVSTPLLRSANGNSVEHLQMASNEIPYRKSNAYQAATVLLSPLCYSCGSSSCKRESRYVLVIATSQTRCNCSSRRVGFYSRLEVLMARLKEGVMAHEEAHGSFVSIVMF